MVDEPGRLRPADHRPEARAHEAAAEHPEGLGLLRPGEPPHLHDPGWARRISLTRRSRAGARRTRSRRTRARRRTTVNVSEPCHGDRPPRRGAWACWWRATRPAERPGNPDHPASRGKTDLLTQAAGRPHDPDRSRPPRPARGEDLRTSEGSSGSVLHLAPRAADGGAGLRVLSRRRRSRRPSCGCVTRHGASPTRASHLGGGDRGPNVRAGAPRLQPDRRAGVRLAGEARRLDRQRLPPGRARRRATYAGLVRSRRVRTPTTSRAGWLVGGGRCSRPPAATPTTACASRRANVGATMAPRRPALVAGSADLNEAAAAVRGAMAPAASTRSGSRRWLPTCRPLHRGESAVIGRVAGSRPTRFSHDQPGPPGNAGATVRYAAVG